jgi:hypothetical protein
MSATSSVFITLSAGKPLDDELKVDEWLIIIINNY